MANPCCLLFATLRQAPLLALLLLALAWPSPAACGLGCINRDFIGPALLDRAGYFPLAAQHSHAAVGYAPLHGGLLYSYGFHSVHPHIRIYFNHITRSE